MQKYKIILKYVLIAAILSALTFFILLLIDVKSNPDDIKSVFGYIPMNIVSDSMSPGLNGGDLIIVKESNPEEIRINDIISFRFDDSRIITHRAIKIIGQGNKLRITTKGDANEEPDNWEVYKRNIIGICFFKIPYGGYFVKLMASWKGFIIMVVIPLLIVISGDLREILSEDKKKIKACNQIE